MDGFCEGKERLVINWSPQGEFDFHLRTFFD